MGWVAVAYVRFAVSDRAHFEVMYRPELYRRDDAEVREARAGAAVLLYGTASPMPPGNSIVLLVCPFRRRGWCGDGWLTRCCSRSCIC